MSNIAKILKEEISRLARKEAKIILSPMMKQIQSLKKIIRNQKNQINTLQTALSTKADIKDSGVINPNLNKRQILVKSRISPKSIKRQRQRLKLSQRQMGLLLGVNTITVNKWETGSTKPNGENLNSFILLRGMGLKEVKFRLATLEYPPKKRGPKPKKKT